MTRSAPGRLLLAAFLPVLLGGCLYEVDFELDPNVFDCDFFFQPTDRCADLAAEHSCEDAVVGAPDPDSGERFQCMGTSCTEVCGLTSAPLRNCGVVSDSAAAITAEECLGLVQGAGCSSGQLFSRPGFLTDAHTRCVGWACTETDCPGF